MNDQYMVGDEFECPLHGYRFRITDATDSEDLKSVCVVGSLYSVGMKRHWSARELTANFKSGYWTYISGASKDQSPTTLKSNSTTETFSQAINNHTCSTCGNDRCNTEEKNCWKCGNEI